VFVGADLLGFQSCTGDTQREAAAEQIKSADSMHTNRLIHEKSPYLLQHADNPVDWYPWGEEAFAKARRGNRSIFLTVVYSTCHWCHGMARESFENDEVAAVFNTYFVAIKADREEHPDVGNVYMTYVQATTGGGGWHMSVWLTPDLKPFVGGTYHPPEDRWGNPGFKGILTRIADVCNKKNGIGLAHPPMVLPSNTGGNIFRLQGSDPSTFNMVAWSAPG
jgi:uncharacterized protein YyaL (SSP411 family)